MSQGLPDGSHEARLYITRAIRRPRPAPVLINAETGRIVSASPLHLRARFSP
jgi:hypothetical protein